MRDTRGGDFYKEESEFPSFRFEANLWFGWVNTPEQFADLLTVYPSARNAKQAPKHRGGMKFGFRVECNGELTLGEWLDSLRGDD